MQRYTNIDFNKAKIVAGEYPTPSVLNRPLVACMTADSALEEMSTFLARSLTLETTDTTRALFRFKGSMANAMDSSEPWSISGGAAKDICSTDNFMNGVAYVSDAVTNLIVNDDPTLTKKWWSGLTQAGTNPGLRATFSPRGAHVTAANPVLGAVAGVPFQIRGTKTAIAPGTHVSFGVRVTSTHAFGPSSGIVPYAGLEFCDAGGSPTGRVEDFLDGSHWRRSLSEVAAYDGVIGGQDVEVPPGTTHFIPYVKVEVLRPTKTCDITFRDFIVAGNPYTPVFTATTRPPTDAVLPNLVNGVTSYTISGWMKVAAGQLRSHNTPIGPFYLKRDDMAFVLGPTHNPGTPGDHHIFRLEHSNNSGLIAYGDEIDLTTWANKYVFMCLRASQDLGYAELVVVPPDYNIYKSRVALPPEAWSAVLGLRLGAGPVYNNIRAMLPLADLMYSVEWHNDSHIIMTALSGRPRLLPGESGEDGIDTTALRAYLEGPPNLLFNPDARLSLVLWNGYTPSFRAVHGDMEIGAGFAHYGAASSDMYVTGNMVGVLPNDAVALRGQIGSTSDAAGVFGVAVIFFDAGGTQVGVSDLIATPGVPPEYYELNTSAPSNATQMCAAMYVKAGSSASRITWAKLKLVRGETAGVFSDDSTPHYALHE